MVVMVVVAAVVVAVAVVVVSLGMIVGPTNGQTDPLI